MILASNYSVSFPAYCSCLTSAIFFLFQTWRAVCRNLKESVIALTFVIDSKIQNEHSSEYWTLNKKSFSNTKPNCLHCSRGSVAVLLLAHCCGEWATIEDGSEWARRRLQQLPLLIPLEMSKEGCRDALWPVGNPVLLAPPETPREPLKATGLRAHTKICRQATKTRAGRR